MYIEGKMSKVELSEKLGRYQKQARIWLIVGLLGIAGGLISTVAVQDAALKTILVAALFGGGLCCVLFLSSGAQKKMKTLMREQLGGLFQAELEKSFGPDLHTPEMRIDQAFMKTLHVPDGQWEECAVENFYEGNYGSIHFSAANVRLDHVYERGNVRDGLGTWQDMVFKGVVLRCETHIPALSMVHANGRTEDSPRGIMTGNEIFDRCFCITAEREQDARVLLTPQFIALIVAFKQRFEGQILCFCWEGNVFSLAIETDYGFASIASDVDMSDLDAVRRSYCNSLREMETLLDLLMKNTVLFGDEIEKEERI